MRRIFRHILFCSMRLFRAEGKFPERPVLKSVQHYRAARAENYSGSGGLLFVNGEPWWQIRSKVQQQWMKTKILADYAPVLGNITDEFIERFVTFIQVPEVAVLSKDIILY